MFFCCLLSQATHPHLVNAFNDLASLCSTLIQSMCDVISRSIARAISLMDLASSLLFGRTARIASWLMIPARYSSPYYEVSISYIKKLSV
jgi:hypothetical protein